MRRQSLHFDRVLSASLCLAASFGLAAGCSSSRKSDVASPSRPSNSPWVARAAIDARSGSSLNGSALFTESDGSVRVLVMVSGASPGKHAVHVHEKGDCSDAEANNAGGHFNPDSHKHGAPGVTEHHAGDFGNVEVGSDGSGRLELTAGDITVRPGPRSIVGRAIVVHAMPDDFVSQPAGNAGGRVGCGVIRAE
ncbi:MAG TPA: superoxide dismutase family protein [Planctomycetota bacterium]|nr:superoxide dismutase family protein [Planctomycetota bacterium]